MPNLRSFTGGMANDEYLVGEDQCVYSENLDCYRDPRFLQLSPRPVAVGTLSSLATGFLPYSENTNFPGDDLVAFTQDKKVIRVSDNTTLWDQAVEEPTDYATWGDINWTLTMSEGGDYVWGDTYMYSMDGADYDGDWTANYSRSTTLLGEYCHPYISETNQDHKPMYAAGTVVKYIEGDPGTYTGGTYSNTGNDIFGMTQHQDTLNLYTRGPGLNHGLLVSTNIAEDGVGFSTYGVKRFDEAFVQVGVHGAADIVVTGYSPTEGTTPHEYENLSVYLNYGISEDSHQLIARSKKHDRIATAFGNSGLTFYWRGEDYITNYNWASLGDITYTIQSKDGEACIYAYGKGITGLPDAPMVYLSRTSTGKKMKRVGALYQMAGKIYYSYEDEDGVFGVEYFQNYLNGVDPTNYQKSGKIFLRVDDSGDFSQEKAIDKVKVGAIIPSGTTIKLSYILDDGAEVDYMTLDSTTQGASTYKDIEINKRIGSFREIAWFAELTGDTSTPKLYNFAYTISGRESS